MAAWLGLPGFPEGSEGETGLKTFLQLRHTWMEHSPYTFISGCFEFRSIQQSLKHMVLFGWVIKQNALYFEGLFFFFLNLLCPTGAWIQLINTTKLHNGSDSRSVQKGSSWKLILLGLSLNSSFHQGLNVTVRCGWKGRLADSSRLLGMLPRRHSANDGSCPLSRNSSGRVMKTSERL